MNIPEPQYGRLKAKAEREGTTVSHVVLRCIDKELESEPDAPKPIKRLAHPILPSTRTGKLVISDEQIYTPEKPEKAKKSSLEPQKRFELPLIRSSRPGTLEIDNETINNLIGFP